MTRTKPFGEKSKQPRQERESRCEDTEIGKSLTGLDSWERWGGDRSKTTPNHVIEDLRSDNKDLGFYFVFSGKPLEGSGMV